MFQKLIIEILNKKIIHLKCSDVEEDSSIKRTF